MQSSGTGQCVCVLSVHRGLHAAIFPAGELGIPEGHTVVFFIFPGEDNATRGVYCVYMLLQFLCLSCVNQAEDIVYISLPASQLTILWCCSDDLLLQVLHVQVHNNGGYWGAYGYSELLLGNFPSRSEVHCLQYKC